MNKDTLSSRIARDTSDGLVVLDTHGTIAYINPSAYQILEVEDSIENQKGLSIIQKNIQNENDDFFQFLLNAVYEKNKTHKGVAKYITRKGNVNRIKISTSFLFGDDGKAKEGILVQLIDETEIYNLRQKAKESAAMFVIMMAATCVWVFAYELWLYMNEPISSSALTTVIEIFGFLVFYVIYRYTSITMKDVGLSIKGKGKYILIDTLFTLVLFVILVGIKVYLLKNNPTTFMANKVFNFDVFDWSCYMYPLTVIVQEFLTRGVIHESIKRIMIGKYSDFWAILVSSLFFGALHIHKGIVYMIGAVLLLSVFGIVYRKQKTIWGLCIPHYVLGMSICLLFEIV